jgi:hypothetical protein
MTRLASAACSLVVAASLQVAPDPAPTGSPLLFYNPSHDRLLLVGGVLPPERPVALYLWTWHRDRWAREAASGPSMRTVTAAAYDTKRRRLVVQGGLGNEGLADRRNDTWEWDGAGWHPMTDRGPGARDHHAMTFDEARGQTVLFGGVGATATTGPRSLTPDTWTWDGLRWQQMATVGPEGSGAMIAYDAAREYVLRFGGVGGDQRRLGETWSWNGVEWRQLTTVGPAPRNGHAMAFDRKAGVMLLFGGTSGRDHFDDFWQWDGQRWTEIRVDGEKPGPRVGTGMAFDPRRDRTVLYGGHVREDGRVKDSTEMWEWDRRRWTRVR